MLVSCKLSQLDINNVFSNRNIDVVDDDEVYIADDDEEEVYMAFHPDYFSKDEKKKVCKLSKSLYNLKQPPHK